MLCRGTYSLMPTAPVTPGLEYVGTVLRGGPGTTTAPGARVMGVSAFLTGRGAFADQCKVNERSAYPVGEGMDDATAAAFTIAYHTGHVGLVRRARVQPGETVLVHGAGGGIGTAAIQLAKALGARVVAVVSSEEKGRVARAAGADDVVPVDGFLAAVKELTGGRGVDLVVDPVGGDRSLPDRFTDSLRSLATEGRLLVIGFTGGEIPTVRVNRLLLNNIAVVGVGWGAFFIPRPGFVAGQWAELLPFLRDGVLHPPLAPVRPLERAAEVLAEMEERRAAGKLVLAVR